MNRLRPGRLVVALGTACLGWLLAACSSLDPYAGSPMSDHLQRGDEIGDCARLLREVDRRIDAAGARDAQAPRIIGFPYLRVDRVSARLVAEAAGSGQARATWEEGLRTLDREARRAEASNAALEGGPGAAARLERCAQLLARADTQADGLPERARVQDHYSTTQRALGLYPITRIPFAAGVRRWQEATLADHASALPWPASGHPVLRYAPSSMPAPEPATSAPDRFQRDPLGLPMIDGRALDRLLRHHAPIIDVETAADDDRIGRPAWPEGDRAPQVRIDEPVLYTRLTHARFDGRWLPQLVYTFWFPARPAEGSLDLLAGRLDGIVWRVTLDEDLQPLVYDTIHPCGCYHLHYPTSRLRDRAPALDADPLEEALFVPQRIERPRPGQRVLLRLAAGSHYLHRVQHVDGGQAQAARAYELLDEEALRRLPVAPKGPREPATRSLYGPDGLVPGTERLERWLFWPMGVRSAGQMRQWGHHATAFVGRRHFDDPDLLEHYFERVDETLADPR